MSQKQVMPKSEDLSRSLEINAIWTFDTEFPTIFIKSCTYITFKSAVKHRQLGQSINVDGHQNNLKTSQQLFNVKYCLGISINTNNHSRPFSIRNMNSSICIDVVIM